MPPCHAMYDLATGRLSCQDNFLALATADKIICNTEGPIDPAIILRGLWAYFHWPDRSTSSHPSRSSICCHNGVQQSGWRWPHFALKKRCHLQEAFKPFWVHVYFALGQGTPVHIQGVHHTTAYNPKSSGLIENFNKVLKSMIKTYVEDHHQSTGEWDVMLPYFLMAYRSSVHSSTGETPHFMLTALEGAIQGHFGGWWPYCTPWRRWRSLSPYTQWQAHALILDMTWNDARHCHFIYYHPIDHFPLITPFSP